MPRGVKKGVDTKKFDRCVERWRINQERRLIHMQYVMPVWAEKQKEKIINQNNIN